MQKPLTVCFYAPVDDPSKLKHVGFYSQDLNALRDLGHEVLVATRWREISWRADVYFVWWWTWAFLPIIKAKLRRKPVIITGTFNFRWGDGDYFHRPLWQRFLLRLSLRAADNNVFVSRHELDPIRSMGWTKHASYSPHCVDTQEYSPGDTERDPHTLFTLGWLRKENAIRKGMPQILAAMPHVLSEIPEAKLVIAGEWDTGYEYLRTLADDLGVLDSIEWPGKIDDGTKIEHLRRCSVYLQPSVYEGFGLAILEAMSCGAPVITRDVGAVSEVAADTAAYVDSSPEMLASEIVRLVRDRQAASVLGAAARARAELHFPLSRRRDDIDSAIHAVSSHSDTRNQDV